MLPPVKLSHASGHHADHAQLRALHQIALQFQYWLDVDELRFCVVNHVQFLIEVFELNEKCARIIESDHELRVANGVGFLSKSHEHISGELRTLELHPVLFCKLNIFFGFEDGMRCGDCVLNSLIVFTRKVDQEGRFVVHF